MKILDALQKKYPNVTKCYIHVWQYGIKRLRINYSENEELLTITTSIPRTWTMEKAFNYFYSRGYKIRRCKTYASKIPYLIIMVKFNL